MGNAGPGTKSIAKIGDITQSTVPSSDNSGLTIKRILEDDVITINNFSESKPFLKTLNSVNID